MYKFICIMTLALGIIIAIILIKYKPTYKVSLSGKDAGYINDRAKLEERIQNEILGLQGRCVDFVSIDEMPEYELKLVNRNQDTSDEEILLALKDDAKIMYKYYAVTLNNETIGLVDNMQEAENAVNKVKNENNNKRIKLDFAVTEHYTDDINSVSLETVQIAEQKAERKVADIIKQDQKTRKPVVNGVLLSVTPVKGMITSRFGAISRRRSGAHTGTDIACPQGTPIRVAASGTVTFAGWSGSYGNVIKVSHGNGVETWYAHCTTLFGRVGEHVNAGDVIASVGSTGNSTGNHLHLEVRVNGRPVNPQRYLYK